MSPPGKAATQVSGSWQEQNGRTRYTGGKWIEITYSRPVLRGRENIFGDGDSYGQKLNAGAPVWRAGANASTRLSTEVALMLGEQTLPAGEYSLFVELAGPTEWTLILSDHEAHSSATTRTTSKRSGAPTATNRAKDVLRVPMTVAPNSVSVDELTFVFVDVTQSGGTLALAWGQDGGHGRIHGGRVGEVEPAVSRRARASSLEKSRGAA